MLLLPPSEEKKGTWNALARIGRLNRESRQDPGRAPLSNLKQAAPLRDTLKDSLSGKLGRASQPQAACCSRRWAIFLSRS